MRTLTKKQASQRLNLSTHTLRFWEKEFEGILTPLRTQGGQRRYTPEHLFIIDEIKRLKRKGLSLIEIRKKLPNSPQPESNNTSPDGIELLANRVAELVKSAIYRYFEEEKYD